MNETRKQGRLGSLVKAGLIASGLSLASLVNSGCESTPQMRDLSRGLTYAALHAAVDEGVRSEVEKAQGSRNYREEHAVRENEERVNVGHYTIGDKQITYDGKFYSEESPFGSFSCYLPLGGEYFWAGQTWKIKSVNPPHVTLRSKAFGDLKTVGVRDLYK